VAATTEWPHWEVPAARAKLTARDVARASTPIEHAALVRDWAKQVWAAWSVHRTAIAQLAELTFARY
jgi:hypothetical protein